MKVEIHTTGHYSQDELAAMVQEFEDMGFEASFETKLVKKSLGAPDIQLALVFLAGLAVGSFVNGFFQKMGEDTWDLVKEGLFRLFQKKKNNEHPRTMMKIPVSEDAYVLCSIVAENEDDFRNAIETLPQFIESTGLRIDEVNYFVPVYYNPEDKWFIPGASSSDEE